MIPARLDPAWLYDKLTASGIPAHMQGGYIRYLLHGIPPGDFLRAVLSNDFRWACILADEKNADALYAHGHFLICCAPVAAWGSPETVTAWIDSFHQKESA